MTKNIYLVLLTLCAASISRSQPPSYSRSGLECDMLKSVYPLNPDIDTSLNGTSVTYYYEELDDKRGEMIRATYNKGILEGPITIKTANNQIYCKGFYSGNKKSGKWTFYYPTNFIAEEGYYDSEKDSSFLRIDCDIHRFLTSNHLFYGVDSLAGVHELKCGIIPYLNIGQYKNRGRIGIWVHYNNMGEIAFETEYRNGRPYKITPYDPKKDIIRENVEYTTFHEGSNEKHQLRKYTLNTELETYFVTGNYLTSLGKKVNYPKQSQKEFYPLATRPVLTDVDTVQIDGEDHFVYFYYIKNCHEDGPECDHDHFPSHNTVVFSPEYGRIFEIQGFHHHPTIHVLNGNSFDKSDREKILALVGFVVNQHPELLEDEADNIKSYFNIE